MPSVYKPKKPNQKIILAAQQSRLVKERADITTMQRRKLAGELVEAAEVEAALIEQDALIKTNLLGLPSKLAPQLAAMKSPADIQALLKDEISQALEGLGKYQVSLAQQRVAASAGADNGSATGVVAAS